MCEFGIVRVNTQMVSVKQIKERRKTWKEKQTRKEDYIKGNMNNYIRKIERREVKCLLQIWKENFVKR